MKGIKLILAACLAPVAFQGMAADDPADAARAATRRSTATSVVSNRQRSNTTSTATTPTATASRTTNLPATASTTLRERTGGTTARDNNVVIRSGNRTTTTPTAVSARTATNVMSRIATSAPTTTQRGITRSAASQPRTAIRTTNTSRAATPTRTATATAVSRAATTRAAARSATGTPVTREDVLSKNYSKCRDVYYNCMDEFCANKDSQLRRCACSSRVNEFDKVKKQLSNVEEKMLDFNQRLLTVNMDKEDAEALFTATDGELAFQQKDTSESKKMLDEIAKKLNTSFDSSNFDTGLSALSWSLNADAAFDNVDSMMGASTTSKSGTELYTAALPVCREMALEVCTDDELAIAESGYQMTIEQDCNTVAKSYETQTDQAREKIREGSALLDMSRLDIYQKRNSDDILTCKKKMLTMLSDTSVCGTDLTKCLDTTGRYIDPSTGEAFLTVDLANLATLISRPEGGQTWTNAPGNETFVAFLNSKKKFLEPAMENCQDIADYVWDEFIEDALAQIKLAQDSKLEVMRQSCTTLTTQCLSDTAKSLEDFDARALSTFGVAADKTVNAMCADIRTACTALLESTGGGDMDWVGGMTEIAADTTYDTIMQTCREVGRACIIQACKSISGNFGLCENIQTSVNRKAIISRTTCWNEVKQCVASAGSDSIDTIVKQLTERQDIDSASYAFYEKLYGAKNLEITNHSTEVSTIDAGDTATHTEEMIKTSCELTDITENPDLNCVFDICATECQCGYNKTESGQSEYKCANVKSNECKVCRLAEKIWGNCEVNHSIELQEKGAHNRIRVIKNDPTATLLSWFAVNTGTSNMDDSCRDTSCGIGFIMREVPAGSGKYECVDDRWITKGDDKLCPEDTLRINEGDNKYIINCCETNKLDAWGNCCLGTQQSPSYVQGGNLAFFGTKDFNDQKTICVPATATKGQLVASYGNKKLICIGEVTAEDTEDTAYPNGKTLKCDGEYIWIQKYSDTNTESMIYLSPDYNEITNTTTKTIPQNYYSFKSSPTSSTQQCKYEYTSTYTSGKWTPAVTGYCTAIKARWLVDYLTIDQSGE